MDLPASLEVRGIIPAKDKIYFFKNNEYSPESPGHYHIAIPTKDSEVYVLLVLITSQFEKKEKHYSLIPHSGLQKALIKLKKGFFPFLTKEISAIDCNEPIFCTREELASKIKDKVEIIKASIPDDLLSEIIAGIKGSPNVMPIIKEYIIEADTGKA